MEQVRKIISFMHISLDGSVAGPNGEMNRIKVDEEIFDHVGKRSVHCPPWRGKYSDMRITTNGGGQIICTPNPPPFDNL
jgi:hypothetical protein